MAFQISSVTASPVTIATGNTLQLNVSVSGQSTETETYRGDKNGTPFNASDFTTIFSNDSNNKVQVNGGYLELIAYGYSSLFVKLSGVTIHGATRIRTKSQHFGTQWVLDSLFTDGLWDGSQQGLDIRCISNGVNGNIIAVKVVNGVRQEVALDNYTFSSGQWTDVDATLKSDGSIDLVFKVYDTDGTTLMKSITTTISNAYNPSINLYMTPVCSVGTQKFEYIIVGEDKAGVEYKLYKDSSEIASHSGVDSTWSYSKNNAQSSDSGVYSFSAKNAGTTIYSTDINVSVLQDSVKSFGFEYNFGF